MTNTPLTGDQNRYIFGITGTVREIVYPSKAILAFKYNGKEEKAILLVHKFLIDGAAVDEQRLMSDILKEWFCHLYYRFHHFVIVAYITVSKYIIESQI